MNPEDVVQRQLEAYNAHDLIRFVAEYSDQIRVMRPPGTNPVLEGKPVFSEYYASRRFNLPGLRAEVLHRIIIGNRVIDHERVTGIGDQAQDVAVVYDVVGGLIQNVWLFPGE